MRATIHLQRSAFLSALASHSADSRALSARGADITYGALAAQAVDMAACILPPGRGFRSGLLSPPLPSYVIGMLGIWAAGGAVVPLSPLYPGPALSDIVADSMPKMIIGAPPYGAQAVDNIASHMPEEAHEDGQTMRFVEAREDFEEVVPAAVAEAACQDLRSASKRTTFEDTAMLLYTSGTTGKPKGVVWTHGMVDFQVKTLANAWRWTAEDRILNVLPLHHVHGIVNVLLTSLYAGAECTMMERFSAEEVWRSFVSPDRSPTVFMAVPTVYQRLIRFYEEASPVERDSMRSAASSRRLFVCGSAALSKRDFAAWEAISGHAILERYGMTETGMSLSNKFDQRRSASLGVPLPGVEVRVEPDGVPLNEDSEIKEEGAHTVEGELLVRGAGVFREYWRRPVATREAFTADGWFRTGDIVRMDGETGRCEMVGRASTDVIKSGGYKISALEVESLLLENNNVASCAVFGVDDDELGQRVTCAVVPTPNADFDSRTLQDWLALRLPRYKVPRDVHVVSEADIPRNAIGKIQKPALAAAFGSSRTE